MGLNSQHKHLKRGRGHGNVAEPCNTCCGHTPPPCWHMHVVEPHNTNISWNPEERGRKGCHISFGHGYLFFLTYTCRHRKDQNIFTTSLVTMQSPLASPLSFKSYWVYKKFAHKLTKLPAQLNSIPSENFRNFGRQRYSLQNRAVSVLKTGSYICSFSLQGK